MLESNLEPVTQLLTNAFFQLNYAYESKDHVYNCQRGTLFLHNLLKHTNKQTSKVGESLAATTATTAHRMKTFFALVPQKVKAG